MNRQVVSFLSLFGLVLVLSIYYILLPTNLFINVPNENAPINTEVNASQTLYFETLATELAAKHQEVINSYESIVASAEYTNAEKEVALNSIILEQETAALENTLVGLIQEEGYQEVYVEILDSVVQILVNETSLDAIDAAIIMTIALENAPKGTVPEIQLVG